MFSVRLHVCAPMYFVFMYVYYIYIYTYVQSKLFGKYLEGYTKSVLLVTIIVTTMLIIVRIEGFSIITQFTCVKTYCDAMLCT